MKNILHRIVTINEINRHRPNERPHTSIRERYEHTTAVTLLCLAMFSLDLENYG